MTQNTYVLPDINSKIYKQKTIEIIKLINQLDTYTNNLDDKLDGLLQIQQNQFTKSYSQHIFKLKQQFLRLQQQLQKHQSKIAYYENQGRLSMLLKRVNDLENQIKKLYDLLDDKNKTIKQLQRESLLDKKQMNRLQQTIKQHLKTKMTSQNKYHNNPQTTLFATQIHNHKQKLPITKMYSQEKSSYHLKSIQKSQEPYTHQTNKLQKQLATLKKKNRQLILFNSKFLENSNHMQNFFFDVVNEVKRHIAIRKKVKQCSLDDFRKQDKMQVLLLLLSNEEIIVHLHQKLFGKQQKPFKMSQINKKKVEEVDSSQHTLPPINFQNPINNQKKQ